MEESSCASADLSYCSSRRAAGTLASHHDGGQGAPWAPPNRNCSCCCCSCPSQSGGGAMHPAWSAGACWCSHLSSATADNPLAACPGAPDCSWNENPHWTARATSDFPSCSLLLNPNACGCGHLWVAVRSCCPHGRRGRGRRAEEEVLVGCAAPPRSPGRTAGWAAQPVAGGEVAGAATGSAFGFQTPGSPEHHC